METPTPKSGCNETRFLTREEYLLAAVERIKPIFQGVGAPLPKVRVSTGWPSSRGLSQKRKTLGECWDKSAATDNVAQIFISPWLDDVTGPQGVLSVLAHELVHAAVGNEAKHGPKFKKVALAIGLEGKMTSTEAGEDLIERFKQMIETLGQYPHAKIEPAVSGKRKQGTRMIKCECETCGYTVRTSRKWLEEVGAPGCPKHGSMFFKLPDETEEGEEE